MYSSSQGANYYAIHSLLYLRTIQEKYIKLYERFVSQLKEYSQIDKNFIKRISTHIAPINFKTSKNIT